MPYDFANLSPDDFQLLVRDLLQAELGILLETFTCGADKGIDLRNVNKRRKLLVVQCKRFSDFRALERVIKGSELSKVRMLKPSRYILATSVPMNTQRKQRLLKLLHPFCSKPGDIFGREDLNNLLQRHPDVERRQFKLWLDSALLLDRMLHDGVFGEDEAALARARAKLRRYVANPSLDRAVHLLESERYCIIAGQPGIGKTTLAEILMLDHVERQQFEAVKISSSLDEIRTRRNPRRRLFFYFDDFLGRNLVEHTVRNEDRRLVEFIEDVRSNPNWRFVLTTREYIYNQAVLKFESLSQAAEHLRRCIINLSDYTPLIRGRILYNHLYYSAMRDEYIRALLVDRRYLGIIKHRNYNPRIIEYMTNDIVVANTSALDYPDDFIRNLDNPNRIWNHAFHRHLSREAQDLLLVLATFSDEVLLTDVSSAFGRFHLHRSRRLLASISPSALDDALRELDGDFISSSREADKFLLDFSNPSIRDFLHATLNGDAATVQDLVTSTRYFEQLATLWRVRYDSISASDYVGSVGEFEGAIESLLSSDSPELIRTYLPRAKRSSISRAPPSTTERFLTVMEVAEELRTPTLSRLVETFITADSAIEAGAAGFDKWGLIAVLTRLSKRGWLAEDSRLFSLTKAFLLDTLDDVQDFKAIGEFKRLFPTGFSAVEWTQIGKQLSDRAEDWRSSVWYDEDDLWGLHSEVEELEVAFPTLAGAMTRELRERGIELESQKELEPPTPYRASPIASSEDSEEIRALFESLLAR